MRLHLRKTHGIKEQQDANDPAAINCVICGFTFDNKSTYLKHLAVAHQAVEESTNASDPDYVCGK